MTTKKLAHNGQRKSVQCSVAYGPKFT